MSDNVELALQKWEAVQALLPEDLLPISLEAVDAMRQLVASYPDSVTLKVMLADIDAFSISPSGKAIELLDDVLKSDPFCVQAHLAKSSILVMKDSVDESVAFARNAVRVSRNIETILNLAEQIVDGGSAVEHDLIEEIRENLDWLARRVSDLSTEAHDREAESRRE